VSKGYQLMSSTPKENNSETLEIIKDFTNHVKFGIYHFQVLVKYVTEK